MAFKSGVPKSGVGGLYKSIPSANTALSVAIPGTSKLASDTGARPIGLILWFDVAGAEVAGRVGFSGDDAIPTITNSDETLGYHKNGHQQTYIIPSWAKFVIVGCNTASAFARGMWLYE